MGVFQTNLGDLMSFVDIREPHTDKLLFRYDVDRNLIEIQRRGEKTLVDLSQYVLIYDELKKQWQKRYDEVFAIYVEMGTPHGRTHDGFIKWLRSEKRDK
jgi:hypothetical protein